MDTVSFSFSDDELQIHENREMINALENPEKGGRLKASFDGTVKPLPHYVTATAKFFYRLNIDPTFLKKDPALW